MFEVLNNCFEGSDTEVENELLKSVQKELSNVS
jgi:hypothetical protein